MIPRAVIIFTVLFIAGCSAPAGRYDIDRYGFDVRFEKQLTDAGYELIDIVLRKTPELGDRVFIILNKPLEKTELSLYDKEGNIFRKFEIGPDQLVQDKIQGASNSSFEYSLFMDAVDTELIYAMTIGESQPQKEYGSNTITH